MCPLGQNIQLIVPPPKKIEIKTVLDFNKSMTLSHSGFTGA